MTRLTGDTELNVLAITAIKSARATFQKLGSCPSIFLLQSKTELGMIEAILEKDSDHDTVDRRMREIIKEKNIDRYVYVSEVWHISSPVDRHIHGSIEGRKDADEAIIITCEDRLTKERQFYIMMIDPVTRELSDVMVREGYNPTGRFVNMFDPPPPPRPHEPLDMLSIPSEIKRH